jgi:acyl transferase domain-containing protein
LKGKQSLGHQLSSSIGGSVIPAHRRLVKDLLRPDDMAVSSNTKTSAGETTPSHTLLMFAGKDASSVEQTAAKASSYAEAHSDSLGDIAHTLARAASKTTQPSHRAFAVVEKQSPSLPIEVSPTVKAPSRRPAVHFIFTGQGAQWAGMGTELLTSYPSFRADIKEMDKTLQQLPHPPLWTIEGMLCFPSVELLFLLTPHD